MPSPPIKRLVPTLDDGNNMGIRREWQNGKAANTQFALARTVRITCITINFSPQRNPRKRYLGFMEISI